MKNILFGLAAVAAVAGSVNADVLDVRVPMDKPTYNVVKRVQFGTVYFPSSNTTQFAAVVPVDSVKLPKVGGREVKVVAGLTSGRYPNDQAGVVYGFSTRATSLLGVDVNAGWAWTAPLTGPDAVRTSAKGGVLLGLSKKF
ncbi:MAG: hypothetical protein ACKOXV_00975 [Bacteroidota bacterium]